MAAIGVGAAPDKYSRTPAAKKGLEKIREYFRNHPPANMHHRAMKMLASLHVDGIMTDTERREVIKDLFGLQKPDGGWGLATLGNWTRSDGKEQDYESSDGYGTGFVIYVLRCAGVPAEDPRIQKAIAWLKTNQRASGRWFTRSMKKDSRHLITHSGTAYAILALAACGEGEGVSAAGASVYRRGLRNQQQSLRGGLCRLGMAAEWPKARELALNWLCFFGAPRHRSLL